MKIRELLLLKSIKGSDLLVGEDFLNREVTGVNVMEVPDIENWVKEGEFLVTSGYSYRANPEQFAMIMPNLLEKGVPAIGIKRKRYFASIPKVITDAAKACGMVLIELDEKVVFSEVVRDIMTEIVAHEYSVFSDLQEKVNKLSEKLGKGEGMQGFLTLLSCYLDNPVILLQKTGEMSLSSVEEENIPEEIYEMHQGFCICLYKNKNIRVYTHEILYKQEVVAQIMVLESGQEISNENVYLLHQISYMIGIELISENIRRQTEQRYVEQAVRDWVTGHMDTLANLKMRSELCGMYVDYNTRYRVVILSSVNLALHPDFLWNQYRRFQKNIGKYRNIHITIMDNCIVMVVPEEKKLCEQIFETAEFIYGSNHLYLCVGEVADNIVDLRNSYNDAYRIQSISQKIKFEKRILFFRDLGMYSLLFKIPNDECLEIYMEHYLYPLERYDKTHSGNLVETLKMYIQCCGNKKATAEKLYTHYNTISYRIERINKILKLNVEDRHIQFEIELAFLLKSIYA